MLLPIDGRDRYSEGAWSLNLVMFYGFAITDTCDFFSDSRRALHRQYSLWLSTRQTEAIIHGSVPFHGRLQNSYDNPLLWFRGKKDNSGVSLSLT